MRIARVAGAVAAAVVCAVVMSGCSSDAASTPDPRLYGTWNLVEAIDNGEPVPLNGSDITLVIAGSSQTGGQGMCAPYVARVIGGIGSVFVKVRSTSTVRDACIPNALVNVDDQYLKTLSASRFAAVGAGALTLTSAHNSLYFVRTSPQENPSLQGTTWTLHSSPEQKDFARTAKSGPIRLTFSSNDEMTISSPCVIYISQLQTAGSTSAAASFASTNIHSATCTDRDRLQATVAAGALIGPMLITLSASPGQGDPATLVITNLNSSIPTVWRADG